MNRFDARAVALLDPTAHPQPAMLACAMLICMWKRTARNGRAGAPIGIPTVAHILPTIGSVLYPVNRGCYTLQSIGVWAERIAPDAPNRGAA